MKRMSITEVKANLSALIARVRGGETIVILDRGKPVARLESIVQGVDPTGRLARLERSGVIRSPSEPPPPLWKEKAPRPRGDASALARLLEERRSSR